MKPKIEDIMLGCIGTIGLINVLAVMLWLTVWALYTAGTAAWGYLTR